MKSLKVIHILHSVYYQLRKASLTNDDVKLIEVPPSSIYQNKIDFIQS